MTAQDYLYWYRIFLRLYSCFLGMDIGDLLQGQPNFGRMAVSAIVLTIIVGLIWLAEQTSKKE